MEFKCCGNGNARVAQTHLNVGDYPADGGKAPTCTGAGLLVVDQREAIYIAKSVGHELGDESKGNEEREGTSLPGVDHLFMKVIALLTLSPLISGGLARTVEASSCAAPMTQQSRGGDGDYWTILYVVWVALAIWGIVRVAQKGHLPKLGCISFILFGWWAILVALLLGPIWLGIAAILEPMKICPYCKNKVAGSATRCEHCQAVLEEDAGS